MRRSAKMLIDNFNEYMTNSTLYIFGVKLMEIDMGNNYINFALQMLCTYGQVAIDTSHRM